METIQNSQHEKLLNFIKKMFTIEESVFYAVLGRRGSGKTDFALFLSEMSNTLGLFSEYATNITIFDYPENMRFINDYETLQKWSKTTKGRKLFILDEAGRVMQRRRPMSKINVQILNDLQTLRKTQLSYLWITPSEKYLDSTIGSDLLTGFIDKHSKKTATLNILFNYQGDQTTHRLQLSDIPKTRINFQTYDSAKFYMLPKRNKREAREPFEVKMKKYIKDLQEGQKPTIQQAFGSRTQYKRDLIQYFEGILNIDEDKET